MTGARIEIHTAAGVKTSDGPIEAHAVTYDGGLDEIGSFIFDLPAEEARSADVAHGSQLWLYIEGEGLVFRGIVTKKPTLIDQAGRTVLRVSGSSLALQLMWKNTLQGLAFTGTTLANTLGADAMSGTLLHSTGWAPGALGVPTNNAYIRYDWISRWKGITEAANLFQYHAREDSITLSGGSPVSEVDVDSFQSASGLRLVNVESASEALAGGVVIPITKVKVLSESEELWNSITVMNDGDEASQMTLEWSDRTTPYAIQSATGPNGRSYSYIEDAASVAAYGRRERALIIPGAIPLSNAPSSFTAAANAMYDAGVTYLQHVKDPYGSYQIEVTGLTHVVDGVPRFQVGDTVRLSYRGIAHDEDGPRGWLTIDQDLILMRYRRSIRESGEDRWTLEVANIDRHSEDDPARLAAAVERVFALQVAQRSYPTTYNDSLPWTSIKAGSETAELRATYDANVFLGRKYRLTFYGRALRSNVTTTDTVTTHTHSITGQATSGGGSHTHSITGQATSGGGGHSHPITSQATSGGGGHDHEIFGYVSGQATYVTGTPSPVSTQLESGSHYHSGTGTSFPNIGNHNHSLANHTHALAVTFYNWYLKNSVGTSKTVTLETLGYHGTGGLHSFETVTTHTHPITGQATSGGGSHSHSVTGQATDTVTTHTHPVTGQATDGGGSHNHVPVYGIYIDPSPPGGNVIELWIDGTDRTVALGGPWPLDAEQQLDITTYVLDVNGQPLRDNIDAQFRAASGQFDIRASLRSLVSESSLQPV